jgi:[histone H3]-lysine27 N-methyltransferase
MPKFEKDNPLFLETRNSICKALYGKNLTFDDDLHYPCAECPSTMNTVELEPNIQKLSERNLKTFLKFKEWTRQGYYAPVTVINHPQQGACVQATIDIPNLTLLCEYVGDVLPVRHVLFEQSNDSIMDLIKAHTSSKSLAICPNKRANLARFISGINNSTKEGKKKQNVKSARFNIQGRVGIILYADRMIKKGEILYYDYNEGGFESYPTEDFI